MSNGFEIEVVQEIWRTPDLTFTVMYPTHDTCSIKGLRGKFTRKDYEDIESILKSKGFTKVLFERKMEDGTYITKIIGS